MKVNEIITEAANAAQQAAIAISMKKAGKKPKNESTELEEEFDLIESIIERLAAHNGVDAEVIWEDLETLTEDELYAFAVTSEPIMESQGVAEGISVVDQDYDLDQLILTLDIEGKKVYFTYWDYEEDFANAERRDVFNQLQEQPWYKGLDHPTKMEILDAAFRAIRGLEPQEYRPTVRDEPLDEQGVAEDWQKANKRDRTDGMSQKAVNAYRRENPGSKLKTAVTTKPSKLKKGGKASKRRKSYCSRSRGQMKMHSISCAKTPDKAICKARRRWNC
jgi:hypothetical protein